MHNKGETKFIICSMALIVCLGFTDNAVSQTPIGKIWIRRWNGHGPYNMPMTNEGEYTMSLGDNKALVRSFLEKANREKRTPVELCAPGFIAHIGGIPAMDKRAFQQYQEVYFASFSDSNITIEDMVAEGEKVAFRGVVRAIHTAEFMGTPASGKKIEVPVIGMAKLAEGKIAEWWNSPDRLSWMQQIGALPALAPIKR